MGRKSAKIAARKGAQDKLKVKSIPKHSLRSPEQ